VTQPEREEPVDALGDPLGDFLSSIGRIKASAVEMQSRVRDTVLTTVSKNRMVTVTTDGSGELLSITFGGNGYRSLPPAELGALLVQTIAEGRRASQAELSADVQELFGFTPAASGADALGGVEDMVERVLGLAESGMPAADVEAARQGLRRL
jgi:DNA-binding protein YbaB